MKIFFLVPAAVFLAGGASAATLTANATAIAVDPPSVPDSVVNFSSDITDSELNVVVQDSRDGGSLIETANATFGSAGGSSSVKVSSNTGTISVFGTASHAEREVTLEDERGNLNTWQSTASGSAFGRITEKATASADGTVTIRLDFDGNWNARGDGLAGTPGVDFSANVGTTDFIYRDDFVARDDMPLSIGLGSVDSFVSISFDVTAGQMFEFFATLGVSTSQGTADFSNTGTLSIDTTPGLFLTFEDPDFLSGPGEDPLPDPPAEVPLPAGLVLLGSGLGILATRRRRAS